MIKGVIFDLDGVIVSTDEFHFQAWKQLADREDIYFTKKINNQMRGVSRMRSLEILLENAGDEYDEAEKEEMAEYKNEVYKQLLDNLSPADILDNVLELMSFLRQQDILLAIGSSSKNTMKILEKINLLHSFDAIADGNDIRRSKPDPEVFLIACKRLELAPHECMVIEDAVAGIEAAKRGGFVACAIGDATNSEKADYKVDNLLKVSDIILSLNK